jgi:hypothetical protein
VSLLVAVRLAETDDRERPERVENSCNRFERNGGAPVL